MQIIILIPAFFIFLYYLQRLVKDDYVFIRKGISSEQVFDSAFLIAWISLFFSRLFSFFLHPIGGGDMFLSFFSPKIGNFSLLGGLLAGIGALFLIGKYKKLPQARLFDFFILAFIVALPFGFVGSALFVKKFFLFVALINALIYLISMIISLKVFYPKLMSRELKEGSLTVIFLLFFALISVINFCVLHYTEKNFFFSAESIVIVLFFLCSLGLFLKKMSEGFINKKR